MSIFDEWPIPSWAREFTATEVRMLDGVVTLTLNRLDAANSRNQQMRDELRATYRVVEQSDDVHVLVLRGKGEKFFCTGMDLKESATLQETLEEKRQRLSAERDIEMLANLAQPTIAAINGYALGGGLEMAMACDLRVAASNAVMGLPEIDHGFVPAGGGTIRLPVLVGRAKAMEMILLGQRVGADEALAIGLVNRVVGQGELDVTVLEMAQLLAARPLRALREAKRLVRWNARRSRTEALDDELDTLIALMEEATLDR
ncbi:MAG: enoyl-CoA hydratase/isomerase family protein [Acidimicrobiia bacterium]